MLKIVKLAVAAAVLLSAAGPVLADTPAERFTKAMAVIDGRFGPEQAFGEAPSNADPEVARSLSDIRTSMEVFGTEAFPVVGLEETFATMCQPLGHMPMRYMMAGVTGVPGAAGKSPSTQAGLNALIRQPDVVALIRRNTVTYQDNIALFTTVSVKCMALHLPGVVAFWEGLPANDRTSIRLSAVRGMRSNAGNTLRGAIITAMEPTLSMANRKAILAEVVTHIDGVAHLLPVAERQRLLAEIIATAAGFKANFPQEFAAISQALNRTDCTRLCLVS